MSKRRQLLNMASAFSNQEGEFCAPRAPAIVHQSSFGSRCNTVLLCPYYSPKPPLK